MDTEVEPGRAVREQAQVARGNTDRRERAENKALSDVERLLVRCEGIYAACRIRASNSSRLTLLGISLPLAMR
jgi:hypothetical protein